jgi:hypothetical protein
MSNDPKPRDIKPAASTEELNCMPEFAKAIQGLSHVPKTEVDKAIAKERAEKNQNDGR